MLLNFSRRALEKSLVTSHCRGQEWVMPVTLLIPIDLFGLCFAGGGVL